MPRFPLTRSLACLALMVLLAPGTFLRDGPLVPNNSQLISFRAMPLRGASFKPVRVGAFNLVRAWQMESRNRQFWGMSGLALRGESGLIAVTDGGWLIGFTPPGRAERQRSFIAPLPSLSGFELSKSERDAESLTHDPETGRSWVGFESNNAILRFGPSFARQEARARPAAMRKWPSNGGPESILRLSDGCFILLRESMGMFAMGTQNDALWFTDDPAEGAKPVRFSLAAPFGYKPTDMTQLPDGRVLILLRKVSPFSGFTAAIMLADPNRIRPGKAWKGRIVARLDPPLAVDNMEGIAAQAEPDGSVTVWLVSDDNNAALQRSLLLEMKWRPERLNRPES